MLQKEGTWVRWGGRRNWSSSSRVARRPSSDAPSITSEPGAFAAPCGFFHRCNKRWEGLNNRLKERFRSGLKKKKKKQSHQEHLFLRQHKSPTDRDWIYLAVRTPGEQGHVGHDFAGPQAERAESSPRHSPADGTVQPFWPSEAECFL